MSAYLHILGVDIGSVAVAVVAINSKQEIIQSAYEFHHGNTAQKLKEILNRFELKAVGGIAATAGTPPLLNAAQKYDSRVAVMRASNFHHARIGSILVVGGEKFGLIRLDENGNYLGFKSNTGCAAGTGSFLDQQARRLNLSGTAELSRLSVIRTLRKARYSTMAILRMMLAFEQGQRDYLVRVLDTPNQEEEMVYVTDQWLTTLNDMNRVMEDMFKLLSRLIIVKE